MGETIKTSETIVEFAWRVYIQAMSERYGVRIIRCSEDFSGSWMVQGDEVFLSPLLTSAELEDLEGWLRRDRSPQLRVVPAPRSAEEPPARSSSVKRLPQLPRRR